MQGKIRIKKRGGQKQKIKIRYLVAAIILASAAIMPQLTAEAASCPNVRVVFARGSGGERWNDRNYLAFKDGIESKLRTTNLSYEFIDLDYPAIGIGIDNLSATMGAYFGSGDAYEFGESVNTGVKNLKNMVNGTSCPNTKYVLGGYSQGAMVVSKALRNLKAERVIYAATFGDPKIYLPEGGGVFPAACRGGNLSNYRMYVPDCRAYKGMLGAYTPYEPSDFYGKVGTWCNKRDFFCSSYRVMQDHTSYVAEGLYEDASKVIFDKITDAYGLENRISSLHDTAILIDATVSMTTMIDRYKSEIGRLAAETFDAGGRIALYYYDGLGHAYTPVKYCDFETCTMADTKVGLERIQSYCSGDDKESLMSASFNTMIDLNWRQGATKSLVVLTAANFGSPDRQGMSLDEVVRVSQQIDPVNFYVATTPELADNFAELAQRTDGAVVTSPEEFEALTEEIMARYDTLPRVLEEFEARPELPTTEVVDVTWRSETEVQVNLGGNAENVLVALNDAILGVTEDDAVIIGELDTGVANTLTLVPLSSEARGEAVEVTLNTGGYGGNYRGSENESASGIAEKAEENLAAPVPKAPKTGKR